MRAADEQFDRGGAKDMARVPEPCLKAGHNLELLVQRPPDLAARIDALTALASASYRAELVDGAKAAVARIYLSETPSAQVLDTIRNSSPDILELSLLAL